MKRCLAVSELVRPGEKENAEYAKGLADVLYGQGKAQEAKQVGLLPANLRCTYSNISLNRFTTALFTPSC